MKHRKTAIKDELIVIMDVLISRNLQFLEEFQETSTLSPKLLSPGYSLRLGTGVLAVPDLFVGVGAS